MQRRAAALPLLLLLQAAVAGALRKPSSSRRLWAARLADQQGCQAPPQGLAGPHRCRWPGRQRGRRPRLPPARCPGRMPSHLWAPRAVNFLLLELWRHSTTRRLRHGAAAAPPPVLTQRMPQRSRPSAGAGRAPRRWAPPPPRPGPGWSTRRVPVACARQSAAHALARAGGNQPNRACTSFPGLPRSCAWWAAPAGVPLRVSEDGWSACQHEWPACLLQDTRSTLANPHCPSASRLLDLAVVRPPLARRPAGAGRSVAGPPSHTLLPVGPGGRCCRQAAGGPARHLFPGQLGPLRRPRRGLAPLRLARALPPPAGQLAWLPQLPRPRPALQRCRWGLGAGAGGGHGRPVPRRVPGERAAAEWVPTGCPGQRAPTTPLHTIPACRPAGLPACPTSRPRPPAAAQPATWALPAPTATAAAPSACTPSLRPTQQAHPPNTAGRAGAPPIRPSWPGTFCRCAASRAQPARPASAWAAAAPATRQPISSAYPARPRPEPPPSAPLRPRCAACRRADGAQGGFRSRSDALTSPRTGMARCSAAPGNSSCPAAPHQRHLQHHAGCQLNQDSAQARQPHLRRHHRRHQRVPSGRAGLGPISGGVSLSGMLPAGGATVAGSEGVQARARLHAAPPAHRSQWRALPPAADGGQSSGRRAPPAGSRRPGLPGHQCQQPVHSCAGHACRWRSGSGRPLRPSVEGARASTRSGNAGQRCGAGLPRTPLPGLCEPPWPPAAAPRRWRQPGATPPGGPHFNPSPLCRCPPVAGASASPARSWTVSGAPGLGGSWTEGWADMSVQARAWLVLLPRVPARCRVSPRLPRSTCQPCHAPLVTPMPAP